MLYPSVLPGLCTLMFTLFVYKAIASGTVTGVWLTALLGSRREPGAKASASGNGFLAHGFAWTLDPGTSRDAKGRRASGKLVRDSRDSRDSGMISSSSQEPLEPLYREIYKELMLTQR